MVSSRCSRSLVYITSLYEHSCWVWSRPFSLILSGFTPVSSKEPILQGLHASGQEANEKDVDDIYYSHHDVFCSITKKFE